MPRPSLQEVIGINKGFICEAQECRYKGAPFKNRAGLTNHRVCKALKEETEREFKEWKRQKALEAKAKAREADTTSDGRGGTDLDATQHSGQNDEPGPDIHRNVSSVTIDPPYSEPVQASGSTNQGVAEEGPMSIAIEEVEGAE